VKRIVLIFVSILVIIITSIAVLFLANETWRKTYENPQPTWTIYITADGGVVGTNQIQRSGNLYTFKGNIKGSIVVHKDNVIVDGAAYTLQGNGSERIEPGIDLTNRINVTIKNIEIREFQRPREGFALLMNNTKDSIVDKCKITDNTIGLWIQDSQNITVTANRIANYTEYGVMVSSSNNISINDNYVEASKFVSRTVGVSLSGTKYCFVSGNNITANIPSGIEIQFSLENVVSNNYVASNDIGVYINFGGDNLVIGNMITENLGWGMRLSSAEGRSGNIIYHNNFINNNKFYNSGELQVSNPWFWGPESNTWDNGKEGNYWSDYKTRYPHAAEIDNSGIGDTHFVINANNIDHYPLINPWVP
jgi:parallel beta-helix repeat protein